MDMTKKRSSLADFPPLVDMEFSAKTVSTLLRIPLQRLNKVVADHELQLERAQKGSAEVRVFKCNDLFKVASLLKKRPRYSHPLTVSCYVGKGGTGKTTMTLGAAICAAFDGLKVLIIDNDPQGDVSYMCRIDPDADETSARELGLDKERTVTGHFGDILGLNRGRQRMPLSEVIRKPFGEHGPHLIPADERLQGIEVELGAHMGQDFTYLHFIRDARRGKIPGCDLSSYDLIFIDNNPKYTLATRNSLAAADIIMSPVRLDNLSERAFKSLAEHLALFSEQHEKNILVIPVPIMYKRNRPRIDKTLEELREDYPRQVTNAVLYDSEDYSKSLDARVPLMLWSGSTENSAGAIRKVYEEIMAKIDFAMGVA